MTLKWPLSIKSCGGNFINMEQKWLLLNPGGRQLFFISLLLFEIIVNSISNVIYLIQVVKDILKEIVCCSFIQSIGYWQHYLDLNNTIILIIKFLQNFSHERLKRSKNQLTQEKDISTSKLKNIYFSCQIKWLNIFLVRSFSYRQINLKWKVNLFKFLLGKYYLIHLEIVRRPKK